MLDIITIGGATRDTFLVSDAFVAIHSKTFSSGTGECLNLGDKIELDDLVLTTGGGASNAAVTFARLGYKTATCCQVGEDAPGRDVIETLQAEGVHTSLVKKIVGGRTGSSVILTMKNGERTILVYRGVSASFKSASIPWRQLRSKWIYLTSLGGNFSLAKQIIEHAAKHKIKIAWNPGSQELEKGLHAFGTILPLVNVFNVNKEEAHLLTKATKLSAMFRLLHREGKITLITDGPKGAYADDGHRFLFAPASKVKPISQTGAGDAFGSGCVAAFIQNKPLETALALGMANAESVIQHYGAKIGILHAWPSIKSLKKFHIKTKKTL
ncbi:MAG: PfkB family kinase, nonfunctional [Candidatus Uhrbacteria bacterium GW2011_GWE2_46_68]|uniref:PfkB family kinase, nonfunctional n=2 Tax=Candidatus Uhriibacteriota TaxID=1752732 RepID=A0A0G1Q9F2_9BACT|nr:MAG: PfkB family kinase, nonfunctional [Candidatus Uhrbacteria bacterium GW2011_GWF2_46_218]KKU41676.1 MAG: PfkB family kinase, nonfunctional [Candidatus Uhrbacteria bacterium GW2011_GWE2_46_68]